MQRYRIEVGHDDQVKPGNIVGAIANEAELDSCYIGSVDIYDDFTLVDLPDGMPPDLLRALGRARVAGKPMRISVHGKADKRGGQKPRGKPGQSARSHKKPDSEKTRRKKHQKRKGKPKKAKTGRA